MPVLQWKSSGTTANDLLGERHCTTLWGMEAGFPGTLWWGKSVLGPVHSSLKPLLQSPSAPSQLQVLKFDWGIHDIVKLRSWCAGGAPFPPRPSPHPIRLAPSPPPVPVPPLSDARATTDIKDIPMRERLWYQRDTTVRGRELRTIRILRTWMSAYSSKKCLSVNNNSNNNNNTQLITGHISVRNIK